MLIAGRTKGSKLAQSHVPDLVWVYSRYFKFLRFLLLGVKVVKKPFVLITSSN